MSAEVTLRTPSSTPPPGIDAGFWRLSAPADLLSFFTDVVGYEERKPQINRQIEAASLTIPFILSFGDCFEIGLGQHPTADNAAPSFVAGLCGAPVYIQSNGRASCLQINFTPSGARRFFDLPMDELTGRIIPVADVLDPELSVFVRKIEDMTSWQHRLEHALAFVCQRLRRSGKAIAKTEVAYNRLRSTGGCLSISALAKELDWSRKHLVNCFRRDIGQPPKTIARVIRFNRVMHLARHCQEINWSGLAIDCGYADQAHLIREFVSFSGHAPTTWQKFSQTNSAPSW